MGTVLPAAAIRTPHAYPPGLIDRNIIRSAAALCQAVAFGPRVFNPAITPADVTAKFSRLPNAGTYLATASSAAGVLSEAHARTWQDRLSDPGSGSLTMEYDDPDLASFALDGDDLVTFFYKAQAAWTESITAYDRVAISSTEEAGEHWVFAGPGHLDLLSRALVFPSRGPGSEPIEMDRPFNWTSPPFPDGSWAPPFQVGTIGDARRTAAFLWFLGDPAAPEANPAFWAPGFDITGTCPLLWDYGATLLRAKPLPAEAGGTCYFRQEIIVPSTTSYDIFFTCAMIGELSIDGQKILTTGAQGAYLNTTRASVVMSAGLHTVAFSATAALDALAIWGLGFNAGFAGFQIYKPGALGGSPMLIAQSDSSAKFVPYAPQPPGMTPGQAMLIAIGEAQARGIITYLSPQFDARFDSAGNAWPNVADIATKVGYDVLTFFQELANTYVDVWMAPGTTKLYAWRHNERGSVRSVSLDIGDLAQLEHKGETAIAQVLLGQSALGWTTHGSGNREALLGMGALASPAEVNRVAQQQLDQFARSREQITAALPATTGFDPYLDYTVGDSITVPDVTDAPVAERVVAVTVTEDRDGNVLVTPELKDMILTPMQRLGVAIKKMTNGTLGGRSKVAQPVVATVLAQSVMGSAVPPPCLADNFNGPDSLTMIGNQLSWNYYKDAAATGGSVHSFTPGSPGTGCGVQRGGKVVLEAPGTLTDNPSGSPTFPVQRCEIEAATVDVLFGDVKVSNIVVGPGPGGAGAGDFSQQDYIVTAKSTGIVSNAEFGYVFWVRLNSTGLIRFYQLSIWTGGSSWFGGALTDAATDIFYGSPSVPLNASDELSLTVLGSGLTARAICKHNGSTVIDFSNWPDFLTDNPGMTAGDLPSGGHHGLWLNALAASNGGAYWTGAHDDVVGFDNFAACPA